MIGLAADAAGSERTETISVVGTTGTETTFGTGTTFGSGMISEIETGTGIMMISSSTARVGVEGGMGGGAGDVQCLCMFCILLGSKAFARGAFHISILLFSFVDFVSVFNVFLIGHKIGAKTGFVE